jgi:hypothetical protein
MKTSIVKTQYWKEKEFFNLHQDSKFLYSHILSSPDRGCINIFRWNEHLVSAYTGMTVHQIGIAGEELKQCGFIDIYEGYIGILKEHLGKNGYRYQTTNAAQELSEIPEDVRAHFDGKPHSEQKIKVIKPKKPKETVEVIIKAQPQELQQSLRDFMQDRLERKKPATTGAVKRWITKLSTMYPNNIPKQVESIEQSIERGWSGMYEVKINRDPDKREFM